MPSTPSIAAPVVPASGPMTPLGVDAVRITGGFWEERQDLTRRAIIPHIAAWLERAGWLGNFDAVADGTVAARRRGREFSDSEAYKLLEAAAWEIARTGDSHVQQIFDDVLRRVAAAQHEDGYLNTNFGNQGQAGRYSDLAWGHELYCMGHLLQAAVARVRTGHRDELVAIAVRAADHLCAEFGDDADGRICGHPEIEPALAEFGRAMDEPRYTALAARFVQRRGHGVLPASDLGASYFQDDMPVRDAAVLRGHAVRALYLSSGAIDVAVDTHDDDLLQAVRRAYERTLQRRTYLTGGMGSHHQDEAFGDDFELPPDRGYCETCAGVGSVMTAWRLLLATGDLTFGDAIERTLFNVIAASPRADGRAFFYTNPLQQRVAGEAADEERLSERAHAQLRAPWFAVACCPPNVARTLAQLGTYVAAVRGDGVDLIQFVTGDVEAETTSGRVRLAIRTDYPRAGRVEIEVVEAPAQWTLGVRVPAWATGATITHRGVVSPAAAPGVQVDAPASGERIVLELPITPRLTYADPRIDAVRGAVAVEAGPVVMCAESVDLPSGSDVSHLRVRRTAPTIDADGRVVMDGVIATPDDDAWPYGQESAESVTALAVPLVPYYSWANRGPSTMRVWLPTL